MKIYIVNDTADMGKNYSQAFLAIGRLNRDPDKADLVVFTGGEDIDPSLYGQKDAHCYDCDPVRDEQEVKIFLKAKKRGVPMFGICRGAQLLCALNGGSLIQHATGHGFEHLVTTDAEKNFMVSSSHHQMMLPTPDSHILAWAKPKLSKIYLGEKGPIDNYHKEVEAVKFFKTRSAGVQYHPEVMEENSEGFKYFLEIVKSL